MPLTPDRSIRDAEADRTGRPISHRQRPASAGDRANRAARQTSTSAIEGPASELGPVASNEMWEEIYKRIAELSAQHRSTLIFVKHAPSGRTRRAQSASQCLARTRCFPSRQPFALRRFAVETERLKAGEVRALVATASLELGIDIGISRLWFARSGRRVRLRSPCNAPDARVTGGVPSPSAVFRTTRDESAGMRRAGACDSTRWTGSHRNSRSAARHSRAADRGHVRGRRLAGRRLYSRWFAARIRTAIPRARTSTKSYAMLSDGIAPRGRGRRALSASRSGEPSFARTPRQPPCCDHQWRRDSRQRALHRCGRAGRNGRRYGGRRFRSREHARRHYLAGQHTRGAFVACKPGRCLWKTRMVLLPTVPFWRGEAPSRTIELSQQVATSEKKSAR